MTNAESLLCLDATLKYLAAKRMAAAVADNVSMAENIDSQWREFDNDRQDLVARSSDRDLIDYELARG